MKNKPFLKPLSKYDTILFNLPQMCKGARLKGRVEDIFKNGTTISISYDEGGLGVCRCIPVGWIKEVVRDVPIEELQIAK